MQKYNLHKNKKNPLKRNQNPFKISYNKNRPIIIIIINQGPIKIP